MTVRTLEGGSAGPGSLGWNCSDTVWTGLGGHGDQTSQLGWQLTGSATHPWELVRRLSLRASVPAGVTRGRVVTSRGVFDMQWTLQGPEMRGWQHTGDAAAISDSDGTSIFI